MRRTRAVSNWTTIDKDMTVEKADAILGRLKAASDLRRRMREVSRQVTAFDVPSSFDLFAAIDELKR